MSGKKYDWQGRQAMVRSCMTLLDIVLASNCCITNYLQNSWLKIAINIIIITVSVDQEFSSGLAMQLWLRVTHEVGMKMLSI